MELPTNGNPYLKDNFAPKGELGHCAHWEGRKGYGNFPDKCRVCVHRPLYSDDCKIERNLQGAEK